MAWISNMRLSDSKTVSANYNSDKVEREFIISFAPGEVKTTDEDLIRGYLRTADKLLKQAIDESLPATSLPSVKTQTSAPASAPASAPESAPPPKTEEPKVKWEEGAIIHCLECEENDKEKKEHLAEVHKSKTRGTLFAICDDCQHFIKRDGRRGAKLEKRDDPQ